MGAQGTRAALVGIAGLDSPGDDRVLGKGAGAKARRLHLDPKSFRSKGRATPAEDLLGADLGGAQDFDAALQAGLGGAEGLGNRAEFPPVFAEALRKEGFGYGPESDAGAAELLPKADRKREGNLGRADSAPAQNGSKQTSIGRLRETQAFFFLLQVEAGVHPGGAAGAVASGAGDGSAVPASTEPGTRDVITTRVPSGL